MKNGWKWLAWTVVICIAVFAFGCAAAQGEPEGVPVGLAFSVNGQTESPINFYVHEIIPFEANMEGARLYRFVIETVGENPETFDECYISPNTSGRACITPDFSQPGDYKARVYAYCWEGEATPTDLGTMYQSGDISFHVDTKGAVLPEGTTPIDGAPAPAIIQGEVIRFSINWNETAQNATVRVYPGNTAAGEPTLTYTFENGQEVKLPTWGLVPGSYTMTVTVSATQYDDVTQTVSFSVGEPAEAIDPSKPQWTIIGANNRDEIDMETPVSICLYYPGSSRIMMGAYISSYMCMGADTEYSDWMVLNLAPYEPGIMVITAERTYTGADGKEYTEPVENNIMLKVKDNLSAPVPAITCGSTLTAGQPLNFSFTEGEKLTDVDYSGVQYNIEIANNAYHYEPVMENVQPGMIQIPWDSIASHYGIEEGKPLYLTVEAHGQGFRASRTTEMLFITNRNDENFRIAFPGENWPDHLQINKEVNYSIQVQLPEEISEFQVWNANYLWWDNYTAEQTVIDRGKLYYFTDDFAIIARYPTDNGYVYSNLIHLAVMCPHEHTETYGRSVGSAQYIPIDSQTHEVRNAYAECCVCMDCNEILSQGIKTWSSREEGHQYTEPSHVCIRCGYDNSLDYKPNMPISLVPGEDAVITFPEMEGAKGYEISIDPPTGGIAYWLDAQQAGSYVIPATVFADGGEYVFIIRVYPENEGEDLFWNYYSYTVASYTGTQELTIAEDEEGEPLTINLSVEDADQVIVMEKISNGYGGYNWYTLKVEDQPGATVTVTPDEQESHEIRAAVKKNGVWSAWSNTLVITTGTPVNPEVAWNYSEHPLCNTLTFSGTGTISGNEGWRIHADKIDLIEIGEGITGIDANAFANLSKTVRVDFLGNIMPVIDQDAFAGTTAVCRHYTTGEGTGWPADSEELGVSGTVSWIYLPEHITDGLDGIIRRVEYTENEQGEGSWAISVLRNGTSERVPIFMTPAQIKEATFGKLKALILRAEPDTEEVYEGWTRVHSLVLEPDFTGSLELTIPAESKLSLIEMYVGSQNSENAALTVHDPRQDGLDKMICSGGTVIYDGNVRQLILRDCGQNRSCDVTITGNNSGAGNNYGNVQELHFYDSASDDPFYGSLTVNGTVAKGFVRSRRTFNIPRTGSVAFGDMITDSFANASPADHKIIVNGELQVQTSAEDVSPDMFSLRYYFYTRDGEVKAGLGMTPKPEYQARLGSDMLNAWDLGITPGQMYYSPDTAISVQTTDDAADTIELGIYDEETGKWSGELGQIDLMYGRVVSHIPVSLVNMTNTPECNEGSTLVINSSVGYLNLSDLKAGSVSLGENASIQNGVWFRKNREQRTFSSVTYADTENGTFYTDGSLRAMSAKDGEEIRVKLPTESTITAAAGMPAIAEVNESSEDELSLNEGKALRTFLKGQGKGAAETVFDATVRPYTAYADGSISVGEPITNELDEDLSFTVNNTTGGNAYVVRLHEENGTVTASAVSGEPTDAATIPFSSDRFSKYVIVNNDAELVTEPVGWRYDNQDLCVLTISGDGAMEDYSADNPAPWAKYASKIERIVIGDGITKIGANAFAGMSKTVRVDFLQDSKPEIAESAFSGTTAICRHYTTGEGTNWPADSEILGTAGAVSWIYLPFYDPYQEENGFIVSYSRPYTDEGEQQEAPRWFILDDSWTNRHEVSYQQAAEISYRGRSVDLEALPSEAEYEMLCNDWSAVTNVTFSGGSAGSKTVNIPVKTNPVPSIRCSSMDLKLTLNVADGGKIRLAFQGGELICNGDVEQLDMEVDSEETESTAHINGNVDKLYISQEMEGIYRGELTVDGQIREGAVYGDALVRVDKKSDIVEYFDHIIVAEFSSFSQSTPIVSDGKLHIPGVKESGDWQDIYAIHYQADYGAGEWSVCLMPKEGTIDSTYIITLKDFSIDRVIYGNTNLVISDYLGSEPLQIGDEDDPTLGIRELGIDNSKVEINCPVYSVATPYGNFSKYDITINNRVEQLWINGDDPTSRVTLGAGGYVEDGWVSRPLRDQLLFGPVSGPKDLYSQRKAHVPCHKINQTISYILPSDSEISTAAGTSAIMDLEQIRLTGDEEDKIALADGEKISNVVDVGVWETYGETQGAEIHDLGANSVDIALVAPAGTRVVRLHETGEGEDREITATNMQITAANDGTIHVRSSLFSKFVLIDRNTWGYEYEPGENLLTITGTGTVDVNGVAPWIYNGYEIDRVLVKSGIEEIGANVFGGLKDNVRIDFEQITMPDIAEGAFGSTKAVCRYTSTDESWATAGRTDAVWAWMPTFNYQGAGTFGPLYYAKDAETPGWSVIVMADNQEYSNLSAATAHEILRYACDDLVLRAIPENLGNVIGNAETDSWVLRIEGEYTSGDVLTLNGTDGTACSIMPREIIMNAQGLTLNITDPDAVGIEKLRVGQGILNYDGKIRTLVLKGTDEGNNAAISVDGEIDALAFYGEGSNDPFWGTLTVTGSISKGFVYGNNQMIMEIPGVMPAYPITGSPNNEFDSIENLENDSVIVIHTDSDNIDHCVVNAEIVPEMSPMDAPTINQFALRYALQGEYNTLMLDPLPGAGIGNERIEINIDEYNPNFMSNLTANICWGNNTEVFVSMPKPNAGEALTAITLTGKDGKGLKELWVSGWTSVTVQCPVNLLYIQPDPMTFGKLDITIEGKIRDAYLQPNNCELDIRLSNGGSIGGGRWKQILRDYRNFGAHRAAAGQTIDLVKDGALAVMSQTDWESLRAILPSDTAVTAATGKQAMATLTEKYGLTGDEIQALHSVKDGEARLDVGTYQVYSIFDVSLSEYSVDSETGVPTEGAPVTEQLTKTIPVTVSSDSDAINVYAVRLHEENGTVTATKLDVTDYQGGKKFESDLFSTYVLVDADAEVVVPDIELDISWPGNMTYYYKDGMQVGKNLTGMGPYCNNNGPYVAVQNADQFSGVPTWTLTSETSTAEFRTEAMGGSVFIYLCKLPTQPETCDWKLACDWDGQHAEHTYSVTFTKWTGTLPTGIELIPEGATELVIEKNHPLVGTDHFRFSGGWSIPDAGYHVNYTFDNDSMQWTEWDMEAQNYKWTKPGAYNLTVEACSGSISYAKEYILYVTEEVEEAQFTTPAALKQIEANAFEGIAAKTVRITDQAETVGDNAFAYSSVEQVIFENGDTQVSDSAFAGIDDLVVFSQPNGAVQDWAERNGYAFYRIPTE